MAYWLPRNVELLKRLWAEGQSAREIAEALGSAVFTRNAVIGKAHRLGLERRPSPIGQPLSWPNDRDR